MKDFYYQIKGLNKEGYWDWPPLFVGMMQGVNSKDVRKKLEEEYGVKLPGGKIKNADGNDQLLCTIMDMSDKPFLYDRFNKMNCKVCDIEYTLNDKYMFGRTGSAREFCGADCQTTFLNAQGIERNVNFDFDGIYEPVIYKITSKTTGMCYIGKTTQAFTLRWYQHFYQSCGTPFHAAIKEYGMADWTFEVIEVLDCKKYDRDKILERESYWIRHYDSINNGYNSVISKAEEIIKEDLQAKLFEQ